MLLAVCSATPASKSKFFSFNSQPVMAGWASSCLQIMFRVLWETSFRVCWLVWKWCVMFSSSTNFCGPSLLSDSPVLATLSHIYLLSLTSAHMASIWSSWRSFLSPIVDVVWIVCNGEGGMQSKWVLHEIMSIHLPSVRVWKSLALKRLQELRVSS